MLKAFSTQVANRVMEEMRGQVQYGGVRAVVEGKPMRVWATDATAVIPPQGEREIVADDPNPHNTLPTASKELQLALDKLTWEETI